MGSGRLADSPSSSLSQLSILEINNDDRATVVTFSHNAVYLGCVTDQILSVPQGSSSCVDAQLIDCIEAAQLYGQLATSMDDPVVGSGPDTQNCMKVQVVISRHGINIVQAQNGVLERHALHAVAQVVSYDDQEGHHNLAVKIRQNESSMVSCHLLQLHTEAEAASICQNLQLIFDELLQSDM